MVSFMRSSAKKNSGSWGLGGLDFFGCSFGWFLPGSEKVIFSERNCFFGHGFICFSRRFKAGPSSPDLKRPRSPFAEARPTVAA